MPIRVWRRIHQILDEQDARRFLLLNAAVMAVALLQAVGVASILPFMELVSNPESSEQNPWFRRAREFTGVDGRQQLLMLAGVATLVLLGVANGSLLIATWLRHRLVWQLAHRVSLRLAKACLRRNYEDLVSQSSAEIIRKSVADMHTFVSGVLLAGSDLVASAMVSAALLVLLFLVQPALTLVSIGVIGGLFAAIYVVGNSFGKRLGRRRLEADAARHQTFSDLVNGIRTIRTDLADEFFLSRFEQASGDFASASMRFQVVTTTPRYLIETMAFGAILAAIIYQLATGSNVASLLPVLTVFALAGYRLLPSLNRVFVALATLRHSLPVVDSLADDLQESDVADDSVERKHDDHDWRFNDSIVLQNVGFSYQGAEAFALSQIDLSIVARGCTAVIGATGSGKSTIADILVGLLTPQSGGILIDGSDRSRDGVCWRKQVGYVPQTVFLYDGTIEENIAFGVPQQSIDREKVRMVARIAQIETFVTKELIDGYQTTVGERGERLSGGQRQRIGIARALYRQPALLILDEATSALDRLTETQCLKAIRAELPDLTILFVTHRLSSLPFCDSIYLLENGHVEAAGSYATLLETSERFRSLVHGSERVVAGDAASDLDTI